MLLEVKELETKFYTVDGVVNARQRHLLFGRPGRMPGDRRRERQRQDGRRAVDPAADPVAARQDRRRQILFKGTDLLTLERRRAAATSAAARSRSCSRIR